MSATQGTGEPENRASPVRRTSAVPCVVLLSSSHVNPAGAGAPSYLLLLFSKPTPTGPRIRLPSLNAAARCTPVLRRRRLPPSARTIGFSNLAGSPWSLQPGAGFLRGGEGVHPYVDGDSLRREDPHRFSRNRYLPFLSPAHRTTSAHADVGKRLRASEPALTVPFPGSALFEVAYPLACHPCNEAGWDEGRPPGGRSRRPRCYE
jgi:hypothetical protein